MMAVTRIFTSIQRPGTGRPPEIDSTSVKDSVNLSKLLTEAVSTAGVIVSINGAGSVNVDGLEDQIKFNP
jgi:predicted neuraminidase